MFIFKLIVFCVTIYYSWQIDNSEIFCSKAFCKTYKITNKCPEVPLACKIQNSTHNGIVLPFYGPCNCCEYCIENLKLGDKCVTGNQAGSPTPKTICGEGLTCDSRKSVCTEIEAKACIEEDMKWQDRRKNGELGHMELRPQCEKNGDYKPTKCIPGETCFCVTKDGERIFGEAPFDSKASFMNCGCSRTVYESNKKINKDDSYSIYRPHCLSDGSFDPIQCINTTCVCVDTKDSFPDKSTRAHITLINKENFPCFDENIHVPGQYLRSCDKEYRRILDEVEYYKTKGIEVVNPRFPACQLDGRYAAVQEDDETKKCVDPNNVVLVGEEEYIVNKKTEASLASTMNCKCARANSIIQGKEKSTCCKNGNYNKIQCRRGLCRCVDSDGLQILGKEVPKEDIATLPCQDDCPKKNPINNY